MATRINTWAARHAHALVSTSGYLLRHGVATTLTVLALSIALALPLALNLLARNVRSVSGSFADSVGLTLYLKPSVSEAQARQLAAAVHVHQGVERVSLITAAQGLAYLRQQSGFGAALDTLSANPLPNVLEVRPTAAASAPAALDALRASFTALPQVDSVQLDRDWAQRFAALVGLAHRMLLTSAVLLGIAVIAVIGNTIRLEIARRSAEIEVTRLVGGSNAFVRRPFLYAGTLYGLVAALLAWLIVALARAALAAQASAVATAYGSSFVLQGPSAAELGELLAAGVVLGWLGAAVAAAHQLARIQPSAG